MARGAECAGGKGTLLDARCCVARKPKEGSRDRSLMVVEGEERG
jgi:hypothetical protein